MSYNFIIHCEEIVMMIRITLFQQWLTLHFSHVFLIIWSGLRNTDTVVWRLKCRIVECEVWSRGLILSFYIPLAGPEHWSSPGQLQLHPHPHKPEIGHTAAYLVPRHTVTDTGPSGPVWYKDTPSTPVWYTKQLNTQPANSTALLIWWILTEVCQKLYDQTSLFYVFFLSISTRLPRQKLDVDS